MAVTHDAAERVIENPSGLPRRQILIIFSGLMLAVLLAALDQTIVSTALPTIVGDLGGLNRLSWVVTAYLLASTVTTPIYGKLGDLYGRKITLQVAMVIFLLGSATSGLARSMTELIVFRLFQGLGAGGIITQVMAIIGDILSPRERGKYQGYIIATFTFASVSGPAVGGLITEHLSWRWCFYVNIPIGLVALVVTSVVLNMAFTRSPHKIDFFGTGLFSLAVGTLILVTVWGGTTYSWSSPTIITMLVGVATLLAVFIIWEHHAAEPLIPLKLFKIPTFRLLNASGFLVFAAMFGTTIYLPLFLQIVTGVAPALSGVLIMPQSVAGAFAGIFAGRRVSATGHYKRYPLIGTIPTSLGIYLLSTMGPTTPLWHAAIFMAMLGFGTGLMLPIMLIGIQNAVPVADLGTGTSSNLFFRSMGSSLGVAIFGSVFNARLSYWLPRLLPKHTHLHLSVASIALSPAEVRKLPHALEVPIVEAFARSLHTVFLFATPLVVLTIPIYIVLRELPLRSQGALALNELDVEAQLADAARSADNGAVVPDSALTDHRGGQRTID